MQFSFRHQILKRLCCSDYQPATCTKWERSAYPHLPPSRVVSCGEEQEDLRRKTHYYNERKSKQKPQVDSELESACGGPILRNNAFMLRENIPISFEYYTGACGDYSQLSRCWLVWAMMNECEKSLSEGFIVKDGKQDLTYAGETALTRRPRSLACKTTTQRRRSIGIGGKNCCNKLRLGAGCSARKEKKRNIIMYYNYFLSYYLSH